MNKGAKTQGKLVKAATALFAKQGIHWVSFQQIAKKAGLSQPALYKYFADKDALIEACALAATESGRTIIDARIDPQTSAQEQIRSYIEGNFLWLEKKPDEAAIILAIYYFAFNHPPLQKILLAINAQSEERLAVRIAAGIRERAWKKCSVPEVARLAHSLLVGEMLKAIHSPKELSYRERAKLVFEAVEKLSN